MLLVFSWFIPGSIIGALASSFLHISEKYGALDTLSLDISFNFWNIHSDFFFFCMYSISFLHQGSKVHFDYIQSGKWPIPLASQLDWKKKLTCPMRVLEWPRNFHKMLHALEYALRVLWRHGFICSPYFF